MSPKKITAMTNIAWVNAILRLHSHILRASKVASSQPKKLFSIQLESRTFTIYKRMRVESMRL